ncbi:2-dehydropantoate 2-reductase [Luteimonas yindakuii]|uniref:2-dehydropantoate 2-reductase n=1 Tax=Luteimonas yindakuii TaxID=2565782 RepID=UPI0010A31C81|nr:2-dehydropantoate 2-reductase [Luteimonas yindakuii]QCO66619.1 2-dehydropantoate 2-reductase [Luteimonas yindakuii]
MRILVLGAGGTGGYFGGRLAQAGVDVTFLVRPARAAALSADGLRLRSPLGDASLPVRCLTADALADAVAQAPYDLAVLSCKAYDLDSAMDAIAPAIGPGTAVLPILNGLRHYPLLDARFGAGQVIGGLCFISVSKADNGSIVHHGSAASITFGERNGAPGARCAAFAQACAQAGIDHLHADDIAREQWIKFTFLATLAAATCLMRASVGGIVATDEGAGVITALYAETLAAAAAAGHPVPDSARATALGQLTRAGSPLKASMLHDLEAGRRVEAAHIVGDMLARVRAAGETAPLLAAAYCHLQAYEALRTG